MDEQKLLEEIAKVQEKMEGLDPNTDTYEEDLKRLDDLNDLLRKVRGEDPEYLKVKVQEEQAEKDRKHGFWMKLIGGAVSFVGAVGLMFAGHAFQNSEIFDKMDERRIEKYEKDNE